jgi:hypothetical protein
MRYLYMIWITAGIGGTLVVGSILFAFWRSGG